MSDAASLGTPALPILMYHNIARAPRDLRVYRSLFVSPAAFARQMWLLRRFGYTGLSMSAAMPYLQGERSGRIAIITLDDGYVDNLDSALPVLQRYGFSATCTRGSCHRSMPANARPRRVVVAAAKPASRTLPATRSSASPYG